jgi:hypothetical protein
MTLLRKPLRAAATSAIESTRKTTSGAGGPGGGSGGFAVPDELMQTIEPPASKPLRNG